MGILYKENLGSPITAVSASRDGSLVAALTDSNKLAVYSAAPNGSARLVSSVELSKQHSGPVYQECDLTFHPNNNNIVVIGERSRIVGNYAEPSLAILLLAKHGQVLDKSFLIEADPPYSSPVVADTDPFVLLIGSASGVICVDMDRGKECGRLENSDEYVAPRGIVPKHRDSAQMFVVWTNQTGSRISSYRRLDDNSFAVIHEADRRLPFFAFGAILSQDDNKLAVSLGNITAMAVEAGKSTDTVSLGRVHLCEPESQRGISAFEVFGQVGRDAVRQQADRLRSGPSGDVWVQTSSLVPKRHLSNLVFIGNDRVAYGTPGGSVGVLNINSGSRLDAKVTDSPITSIITSAEPNLLCVGCANGSVCFLAVEP